MQDDIDLTQGNAVMDAIDQETIINALGSLRAYGLELAKNVEGDFKLLTLD